MLSSSNGLKKHINKIIHGDALRTIKRFPSESIDCVITSPPYWQMRDYKWKGQWGLEKTYHEYLENLWSLMEEIKRVLKKNGTVWINLGDTYGTQSGACRGIKYKQHGKIKHVEDGNKLLKGKVPQKSLLLLPHRFAIGCIERGWLLRNDIVWGKPNALPESAKDRFSKKHEYVFFLVKNKKYHFDLDSIREPHQEVSLKRMKRAWNGHREKRSSFENMNIKNMCHPKGRNPGDVSDFWKINTQSGKDKHYAKFNTALIEKPILAGCPKGGIVLDPFCGSGTTGIKAIELGRKFIGIEGKKSYCRIARRNIAKVLN
ncbi:MAG: site-specific DNA-methyltransferase [Bacteroidetes bacterium]|nr:site-specific DNA-methyltransferase [Bacteroidota bacterium]